MSKVRNTAILPGALCVLALALSGCVSHYRVETGTPAARIRLVTNTDDNTTFNVVDATKCPKPPKPLLLGGTGKQLPAMGTEHDLAMVGASPEPPSRTRERWLVAGQRIYLTAAAAAAAAGEDPYRCAVGVSFVPLPGWQYELRYQRNAAAKRCSGQVLRLAGRDGREIEPEPDPTQLVFRGFEADAVCAARGLRASQPLRPA
ncbi:hypothetical protein OR16_05889 [Cupriavidus basilensis OR16]|uniref:Lipoprotein n=1 Tax=Cupriavidus basilensis OR16 TaxID=1127483 RepID=H1S0N6_9BURK|nr:hypothetical protein [Cupriavidus basilensis]EHP43895.1 hypothetical protein OR16_05889 [Cupriavidus basilensis OR16]